MAKRGGGRPKAEIDLRVLRTCAAMGATLAEAAAQAGVGHATLDRRLAEDEEVREAWEAGKARGRMTLRRWQWRNARSGSDTMLIWLGKQMLGQKQDPLVTVQIDQSAEAREREAEDALIEALIGEGENVVEHPKRKPKRKRSRSKTA
jgi:hypothetical protein